MNAALFQDFGDLGDLTNEGGPATSNPVGYITGPALPELVITVPWGTDLSNAVFTFSQESEITGTGNYFFQSAAYLSGGTAATESLLDVSFQSVPEPSSGLFLASAALSLFQRRRTIQ